MANNSIEEFEAESSFRDNFFVLVLYITGMTPNSRRAVENIKKICDEHLKGRHNLKIIDIYQEPSLAEGDQILAAPTLVKISPDPVRKMIGDMSDTNKVLTGLGLIAKSND